MSRPLPHLLTLYDRIVSEGNISWTHSCPIDQISSKGGGALERGGVWHIAGREI